jgi:DNA-directed RNA polymerase subunit N (RpoN/RPB10)
MKKSSLFTPKKAEGQKTFNGRARIDAMYHNPEWRQYSREYLRINTRCYSCGSPSEAVDHVKIHRGDESLFTKIDNMIPLCFKCHNTVTALFDRYAVQKLEEKMMWLSQSRQMNELTFRVSVVPYRGKASSR